MHYSVLEFFLMNRIISQYTTVKNVKIKEIKVRDKGAEIYDSLISDYQHHIEISTVINKLNLQKGDYILDAGCGTGRITFKLIEAGCKVVALDFSKESLKICKQRCGILYNSKNLHLIKADICNLPLKGGLFDKCISSEVFEQLPTEKERLKMLNELNMVLKFNGKLILTTYNYNLRKIISRKRETITQHLYFYRYDYLSLKKIISLIFRDELKISGIINFRHWIPHSVLHRFKNQFMIIDKFIEKTPVSYLMAHLLLVECKKRTENPNLKYMES